MKETSSIFVDRINKQMIMDKSSLKHIVFIQVIDVNEGDRIANIEELKNRLEKLPKYIDEIVSLEVGRNISDRSNFDLSLLVILNNEADLNAYRTHPKHVEVLDFMKTLEIKTAVVVYVF
jgi:hypothetical protein